MKTGLVLEGGGAKGAFHCGAIKALYDNGFSFDGAVGTSIGAINAAVVVQEQGYKALMEMWTDILPSMLLDVDDIEVEKLYDKEFSKSSIKYWIKQAAKAIKNLGIPIDKSIEFLKLHIFEDKVRASNMDFGMVTYSISDREPMELFKEDIPEGSLLNYIFASAYYPVFRLKRLDGKYFIDGGVYDNMPIALLAQKNYDKIIAIRTNSKMRHSLSERTDLTIDYICPSEDLGKTMQVTKRMINRNIKLGYYDALRYIKGFIGNRFYIDGTVDELKKAFTIICGGLNNNILKNFDEGISLNEDEKFILTMEEYAIFCGMEKFKIYTPNEFAAGLFGKMKKVIFNDQNLFQYILKNNSKKIIQRRQKNERQRNGTQKQ